MLSPGGVGRPRSYRPRRRRRRARVLRVLGVLCVLALLAAGGWYFFFRDADAEPAAAPNRACPTPKARVQSAVAARQTQVNVYNATARQGLAAQTAAVLKQRGFVVGKVSNDPLRKVVAGPAEVRSGAAGRPRAALVTAHVAGAVPLLDKRPDLTVDLVLGQRFVALRPPAEVTKVLAPPKPPGC
jgi:LytR cell envelope-related transcriptional attenuator